MFDDFHEWLKVIHILSANVLLGTSLGTGFALWAAGRCGEAQSGRFVRVLLTGANGFIGRYLLAGLVQAGHDVVPAVRRPVETDRLLSHPTSIRVDFNRDVEPAIWLPRLAGIDAVVNCV